jgi:membrane associated rhomboid family serine protease
MIPIRDQVPTRRVPVVNYALIALNVIVYILQVLAGAGQEVQVYQFALVPAQVTSGVSLGDITDIFTSMFMHAGILHLGGNMLYLWIFGDNIEDALGPVKYLVFYLAGGALASIAHILTNPTSQIPTVGASGAIAAVLGAYLVLYPGSRVLTLIPLGYFSQLRPVPAFIVLGLWFFLQFFSGVLALGGPDVGGVAFWAHIGGFVFGVVTGLLFAGQRRRENMVIW